MTHQHEEQSLYQSSHWQIFSKNFVAGLGRALGAVMVQLFFFVLLFFIFSQFISPLVSPIFNTFQRSVDTLEGLQEQQSQLQNIFPFDLGAKEIDPDAPVQTR